MNEIESIQEPQKTEGDRVWNAEHFGPNGTIAVAFYEYERAVYNESCEAASDEDVALASMNYAMTLYSAIGNCLARIKKFQLEYLLVLSIILFSLRKVVSHIVQWEMYEQFDASQKEAFMAYLLVCRFMSPFSGYRKLAIKLGEEVLFRNASAPRITQLLVRARLSKLWFYPKKKECREIVLKYLNDAKEFSKLDFSGIDWRTVNRLARLIGDKEMKEYSASLANSQDVMIKSGM